MCTFIILTKNFVCVCVCVEGYSDYAIICWNQTQTVVIRKMLKATCVCRLITPMWSFVSYFGDLIWSVNYFFPLKNITKYLNKTKSIPHLFPIQCFSSTHYNILKPFARKRKAIHTDNGSRQIRHIKQINYKQGSGHKLQTDGRYRAWIKVEN